MSGPKSYGYSVSAAAYEARMREARERALREQRERERQEKERRDREALLRAQADFDRLEDEVTALRESGIEIDDPAPLGKSAEGLPDAEAAERIGNHVRAERERLIGAASRFTIEIAVEAPAETLEQAVRDAVEDGRAAAGGSDGRDFDLLVTATVERLLGRLMDGAGMTPAIESAMGTARNPGNDPGRRRLALDALRSAVAKANSEAAAARERQIVIDDILLSLAGIESEAAKEIEDLLEAGGTDADLARIEARADRLVQKERSRWEAGYVVESLTGVLDELGYGVEEGFTTAIGDDGFADLGHNRWPGYAIRVRHTSGGISLNVIRGVADRVDQSARDADIEQMWCSDVRELEQRLLELGVDLSRIRALEPGELEMQVVPEIQVPAGSRRDRDRDSEGESNEL